MVARKKRRAVNRGTTRSIAGASLEVRCPRFPMLHILYVTQASHAACATLGSLLQRQTARKRYVLSMVLMRLLASAAVGAYAK